MARNARDFLICWADDWLENYVLQMSLSSCTSVKCLNGHALAFNVWIDLFLYSCGMQAKIRDVIIKCDVNILSLLLHLVRIFMLQINWLWALHVCPAHCKLFSTILGQKSNFCPLPWILLHIHVTSKTENRVSQHRYTLWFLAIQLLHLSYWLAELRARSIVYV